MIYTNKFGTGLYENNEWSTTVGIITVPRKERRFILKDILINYVFTIIWWGGENPAQLKRTFILMLICLFTFNNTVNNLQLNKILIIY